MNRIGSGDVANDVDPARANDRVAVIGRSAPGKDFDGLPLEGLAVTNDR